MSVDEMLDVLPTAWVLAAFFALAVGAAIFIRLGRRRGWKWALCVLKESFFPSIK